MANSLELLTIPKFQNSAYSTYITSASNKLISVSLVECKRTKIEVQMPHKVQMIDIVVTLND